MTEDRRVEEPSKFVSIRLSPKGQRALYAILDARPSGTEITEVIHEALEREARAVRRQQRSAA